MKFTKIKDPRVRQWFETAMAHGQARDSWTEIEKGSEQHKAWIGYFTGLSWMPITLTEIDKNKSGTWTAPCAWPHDLEASR